MILETKGECPGANSAIDVITGKWKPRILYRLSQSDSVRFNELRRFIPEITQKMLTAHLRELEEDGVVSREIYPEVPPRVEYSLTEYGQSIIPILQSLQDWGMNHLSRLQQNHDGSTGTRTQM
ncbi:helix-turn-helix transcriptional regulator [Paenibacillus alvei]|uniref:Helix-turn-helix transcriptional regulator n=1 Tax=Paenibacillus alvei TaxID=44250 RepID=A0ABT4H331_PAEAL|nr:MULTISPECIES: helix-turn-helix domain-containing protein [Paenibacillus]MCY9763056.1 helix-turn-helix transcriptional regulator [Paenibacillus alvei]MCY9766074.1 helix-turn-helix transcriptional regulator [Paenibacillus alvei]